jgi:Ribbon-helix-helix domain
MVRKQIFIREDQQERLKSVAAREGVAEAELVREGLDLVLERKAPAGDESWRDAVRNIEGMWKDRTDLDEFYAENRRRRAERRKNMNALLSKWRA